MMFLQYFGIRSFNVLFCGNFDESSISWIELMLWFENKLLVDWNRIVRSNLISQIFLYLAILDQMNDLTEGTWPLI